MHSQDLAKATEPLWHLPSPPPTRYPRLGVTRLLYAGGGRDPQGHRGCGVGEVAPFPSPLSLLGSERSQAPPSRAEALGGGTGYGTVAKVGRATVLGQGRRQRSPRGAGLPGRLLLARGGRVSWAGEPQRPLRVPPAPRVAGDVCQRGGVWSGGTGGSDVGPQRPGHGGGGGGSCCLSSYCGTSELGPGVRA